MTGTTTVPVNVAVVVVVGAEVAVVEVGPEVEATKLEGARGASLTATPLPGTFNWGTPHSLNDGLETYN